MNYLAVGIGGAIGAVLRFLLGEVLPPSTHFPYITLCINWSGSFLFAYLFGIQHFFKYEWLKLSLTTGFLGGFTTFSTFSVDTIGLLHQELYGAALLYVIASSIGSIFFSFVAFTLANKGGRAS
jgi:CrcB protein